MIRGSKLLLMTSRTLVSNVTPGLLVQIGLIVFFFGVGVYYLVDRKQSFTVQASTQSVTVKITDGPNNVWSLGRAILCLRNGERILQDKKDQRQCDPDYYTEHVAVIEDLEWPVGTVLMVSGYNELLLSVEINVSTAVKPLYFNEVEITDQSVLFFERSALHDQGSFALSGIVKLGQPAEAGGARLLRSGHYEIREYLGLTSGSSVVSTGMLLTGDYAELTDRSRVGIPTSLFLTESNVTLADFDVILTSPPESSMLVIKRIGSEVAEIRPKWTDRLVNDALPLAVSILLGLFGASLGIVKNLFSSNSRPKNSGE